MLAIADLGQVGVCLATATISRNPHLFYPSSPFSLDLGAAAPFSFAPTLETAQVRAWFFDDSATVVQQVLSARMDLATAACLAGPCQAAIDARYTSKGRKVIYVHDWSACQQYDVEARERLLDWGKAGSAMTAQTVIAVSSSASPFVQIALSTGTLVMRLLGMKISVVPSLGAVLAPLAAHGAAARLEGP